ncbi:hypothetical protein ACB094_12G090400 [Castanea mollissima]
MEHSVLYDCAPIPYLIKASFPLNDARPSLIHFPSSSGSGNSLNFSLLTSSDKIISVQRLFVFCPPPLPSIFVIIQCKCPLTNGNVKVKLNLGIHEIPSSTLFHEFELNEYT